MIIFSISFALFLLCFLFYMIANAFHNEVKHETIEFSNFPDHLSSFSIFFISDIHRRNVSRSIVERVKNKADIVMIGGDLTEKGVPNSRIRSNLAMLSEIGPLYFVWGNNDYEVNLEQLEEIFDQYNVLELKNDIAFFANDQIALIGIDDLSQPLPPIEWILDIEPDVKFQILVSHNPNIIEKLPENHNINLILSGHTHGGQIRIFGLGPYKKGEISYHDDFILLVSNGYGTSVLPLRLGAKAETHLLILKKR